ncbi:MAG: sigma-54 interaction domain-containing protein, partial [Nitrospinota bacterium]
KNALENKRLKQENSLLKQKIRDNIDVTTLVGESEKIKKTLELVKRVSSTKATVFIHGESGTGKELVANIIHYTSPVADGPFIKVNCSALAEGVMESELFGHEKGAFTGAAYQKKGRFELADKGTLFLDEIGDLPPFIQVKLLRFLQESEFERVGGTKTIKVNVRIVSATNKNLEELVRKEKFRDDLFYRLKVVTIDVIPLRERKKDVQLIAEYHLKRLAKIHNKAVTGISPEALKIILAYSWPGNIRELINCVESAVVMTSGDEIDVESLPSFLFTNKDRPREEEGIKTLPAGPGEDPFSESDLDKCLTLFEIEKKAILEVYNKVGGNKAQTAKQLGIGLRTLYRKLEQYGVKDDTNKGEHK